MTTFLIPISDVKVSRDRIREDLGPIDKLVDSIKQYGQLQPIIVDENNELIDGMRRYTATAKAGITNILAMRRADVDELLYRELELETNIQRKDMTWQERVRSIAEIDKIRRIKDPTWNQPKTAALAGVAQRDVSYAVNVAKMVDLFPEIATAKSLNQAISWAKHKAATAERLISVAASPEIYESIEECITLGDSIDVIKQLPSETFHAVITDPPFGIDYKSRKVNMAGVETLYDDSKDDYERILSILPNIYRVIKPNGWLVWFFGMSWYERVYNDLTSAGFAVDPIPIVWNRSDGTCHTNRADLYMAKAYDVAFHCRKGNPEMILRGKPNVITVPPVATNDRELTIERPVELYAEIIKRLTVPGEYIADFFVGSGSALAAAASTHRRYWGCELNPERRIVAVKKIHAYTPS